MKAGIVEVYDMLSALSVLELEKRIGEVLGVESVRVNYAAAAACACDDSDGQKGAFIRKHCGRPWSRQFIQPVWR